MIIIVSTLTAQSVSTNQRLFRMIGKTVKIQIIL